MKIVIMLPGSGKNLVRLPGKLTQPKKYGWITDTDLSTFNGLDIVYRETFFQGIKDESVF